MPINKNALVRYQTLDRCFRNPGRKYFIDDLVEECSKALSDLNGVGSGVQKRQVQKDISFMESPQGYNIPLERMRDNSKVYFRYSDLDFSISNQPINELEAEQLKSAMLVLQKFKGLPHFKWINELLPKLNKAFNLTENQPEIISFDNNQYLKGLEFIDPLFNAILYKKCIRILYQSFRNPEPISKILSPHHLKEFNNRWYIYGKDMQYESVVNLALDRIVSMEETNDNFLPSEQNFEEYFEDSIGVSIDFGATSQKVILRIEKNQWPYIETKPIHGSQKVVTRTEDFINIQLELIPNYELESHILHYGEKVEVLEPLELREKIKTRVEALNRKYTNGR